jgi:hypothetical protein
MSHSQSISCGASYLLMRFTVESVLVVADGAIRRETLRRYCAMASALLVLNKKEGGLSHDNVNNTAQLGASNQSRR